MKNQLSSIKIACDNMIQKLDLRARMDKRDGTIQYDSMFGERMVCWVLSSILYQVMAQG